jgi:hypothetical protein
MGSYFSAYLALGRRARRDEIAGATPKVEFKGCIRDSSPAFRMTGERSHINVSLYLSLLEIPLTSAVCNSFPIPPYLLVKPIPIKK